MQLRKPLHFSPVCRQERKAGVCPKLSREQNPQSSACMDECYSDSDCTGDKKCCFNGCARSCLPVVLDPGMTEEGQQEETLAVDPNAPKIRVVRPTIVASEGSVATLSVQVSGYPNPDVYWRKGRQDLDTRRGKYQILSGGTLQVSSS